MDALFAYGTLMCEDIMLEVAGLFCPSAPATLTGYQRLCVKGQDYPALVPNAAECVAGVVYYDVPTKAWERLDRFEGEMYTRQSVSIELNAEEKAFALAYVTRPECLGRLETRAWSVETFLDEGKDRFVRSYMGYQWL
jgi:gamma-glutamylcyclotransferase (GGCT)/AIG2-like uncharacterized protein YtfP